MLKESLIGWGGVNFKQEKIILDNQKVYTRTRRGTRTDYVRGPFYRWTTIPESGVSYTVDTIDRYPQVGDHVFQTGKVYRVYDDNTIDVCLDSEPGTPRRFQYSGVTSSSTVYGTTTYINRIYPINIDDSQTDRYFDVEFNYKTTTSNERYYFDKETQCLVRMAIDDSYGSSDHYDRYDMRQVVFDLFDPNTGEQLDHHVIWGYSHQQLVTTEAGYVPTFYFPNCTQGLYGVYLNGLNSENDVYEDPKILLYHPRRHRVFEVNISTVISINTGNTTLDTVESFLGAYNQSTDYDDLSNIAVGFYCPQNSAASATSTQEYYKFSVNLETNPATITFDSSTDVFTLNSSSTSVYYSYQWDLYPSIPSSGWTSIYADSNDSGIYKWFITYATKVTYTDIGNLRNIVLSEEFMKNYTSSSLVYSNYTTKNNQMGSAPEGFYIPMISNRGWNGNLIKFTQYAWYQSGTSYEQVYLYGNPPSTYPTISNTTWWPRLYTGPKCKITAAELNTSGLIFELNGVSYYKNNNETAHGGFMKRLMIASNNNYYNHISFAIISETEEGAKCYTSENSTPTISGTLTYKGKTYYYYRVPFNYRLTSDDVYTNHQLSEYYLRIGANDSSGGQILTTIIGNGRWEYYVPSTLIKDLYEALGDYTYKILYGKGDKELPDITTLSLYDMSNSYQRTVVFAPLSSTPCSENVLVLTTKTSNSGISRYLNVVSSVFANSQMTPLVTRVDCYRNTQYLADVSTNTSTVYQDGGTNVPPICVTSGESFDVTLTVSPNPGDATVTFSTGTVSGNTCTVPAGTPVTYTVSKTNYETKSGTINVGYNQTVSVSLSKLRYTLTVSPNPGDSTVTFSTGTVSGNSCTVDVGTNLTYTVSKTNMVTQSETITVNSNITVYPYLIYQSGVVLLYATSGSSSLTLRGGNAYIIDVVGAGAGAWNGGSYHSSGFVSSSSYQKFRCISGGSGAYMQVVYDLVGSYEVKPVSYSVGVGGAAEWELDDRSDRKFPDTNAGNGGDTVIYLQDKNSITTRVITAGGGIGGNGRSRPTPSGGSCTYATGNGISISKAINGNAGNYVEFTDQSWHNSEWVASPYGGDVGKGGNAGLRSKNYGNIKERAENPGIAGLIKITVQ